MTLQGKHVLVTGAGGFIGSHLAERLVSEGARVRAFVHYNALGRRGWLDDSAVARDMEIVAGDITDRDFVADSIKDVEYVFHLAALIGIPYSYLAPESYVRVNIRGTLNVLLAARESGVERLVHASTSEVYGTARSVPITEAHPLQAQSPYAASKIGADKMAEAFAASFGVPIVTVRPFNTYGPRQSARAVIPTIITQALAGAKIAVGNLTPTRDLNYVSDTVDGFVKAAAAPGAIGRVLNLGTGRETSIRELVSLVCATCGRDAEIAIEADRIRADGSEVERLVADASTAREVLGWRPSVELEEGLARTVAWFRENVSRYHPEEYGR